MALRRALFATVSTVALFGLAEGLARHYYPLELRSWAAELPVGRKDLAVMAGNPYLLYEYPTGMYTERGVNLQINSLGLRGPEPAPKPARRFMVTGDSSVFGFGVADDQTFAAVADDELGPNVDHINAATSGYSTFGTINLLNMRALALEPDLLVVGNLWSDNNFDSFVDKDLLATYAGFESSVAGRARALLTRSAIFRVLDWRLRVAPHTTTIRKVGWQLDSGAHSGQRRVAINDYAANLDRLVDIAASKGAETFFVLLPNNEDLTPRDPKQGGAAWEPYRRVMRETAARRGTLLLDVPELFLASGEPKEALFQDEMHPTARGHRIIGESLAAKLQGWAAGQSVMSPGSGEPLPTYADPFLVGGDVAQASASGCAVRGEVLTATPQRVLIDVVSAESDPNGRVRVLGSATAEKAGAFAATCGAAAQVALRVYVDANNNGPDAADRGFAWPNVLNTSQGVVSGLIIDVDAGTLAGAPAPPQ